jgi:hypothetical protein
MTVESIITSVTTAIWVCYLHPDVWWLDLLWWNRVW